MSNPNQTVPESVAINTQGILQKGAAEDSQSVAQSTDSTLQATADNLHNINTISTTAAGVAMSQMLAKPDPVHIALYKEIITNTQNMTESASTSFPPPCPGSCAGERE